MITLKHIIKAKPVLSIRAILLKAFPDNKDFSRVRSRIERGTPELDPEDAKKIQSTLKGFGVTIDGKKP